MSVEWWWRVNLGTMRADVATDELSGDTTRADATGGKVGSQLAQEHTRPRPHPRPCHVRASGCGAGERARTITHADLCHAGRRSEVEAKKKKKKSLAGHTLVKKKKKRRKVCCLQHLDTPSNRTHTRTHTLETTVKILSAL